MNLTVGWIVSWRSLQHPYAELMIMLFLSCFCQYFHVWHWEVKSWQWTPEPVASAKVLFYAGPRFEAEVALCRLQCLLCFLAVLNSILLLLNESPWKLWISSFFVACIAYVFTVQDLKVHSYSWYVTNYWKLLKLKLQGFTVQYVSLSHITCVCTAGVWMMQHRSSFQHPGFVVWKLGIIICWRVHFSSAPTCSR